MVVSTRLLIFFVALSGLISLGCQSLHFRHASVVRTVPDAAGGTRVHVTFEVWDGEQQLTGLSREAFSVLEDGQPATSESLSAAGSDEIKPPVVLLLDTSYSMYLANAVPDLKRAASKFADVLSGNGFTVETFRFANKIEPVANIADIPEQFAEETGERFTSLYAAVNKGFGFKRDAIVVVFSDGADNYSKNHGVSSLGAVETFVLPTELTGTGAMRIVHCIAFGDVQNERDKDGVPGLEALRRISRNGSLTAATDKGALDAVFNDVAHRIRNVYVFEFLSPSTTGSHLLEIEVRAAGQTARSEPMKFVAGGAAEVDEEASLGDPNEPIGAKIVRLEGACAQGDQGACAALKPLTADAQKLNAALQQLQMACGQGQQEACAKLREMEVELFGPGGLAGLIQGKLRTLSEPCIQGDDAACGKLRQQLTANQFGVPVVGPLVAEVVAARPEWIESFQKDCEANQEYSCLIYWSVNKPAGLGVQFDPNSRVVTLVQPGGSADTAGVQLGDLLFAVDGQPLESMTMLQRIGALRGTAGSKLKLTVTRGGKKVELDITRKGLK